MTHMCVPGLSNSKTNSWVDAIGSTAMALGFHGFIGLIVVARIEVRILCD